MTSANLGYSTTCDCLCCVAFHSYYHGNDDAWAWSIEGLKWFRGYAVAMVISGAWTPNTADEFMLQVSERMEDSAASMKAVNWEPWFTRK